MSPHSIVRFHSSARSPMRHSLFLLCSLVLTVALAACETAGENGENGENGDEASARTPVEVVDIQSGVFEDVVELTGTVASPEDAQLSAETSGTITSVAELGTFVRRGQSVAQVNPSLAQASVSSARAQVSQAEAGVESAQAQLDMAQDRYDRQEPLYRDSILSALEFRSVQTQLSSAKAAFANAEAALEAARAGLQQAQTQLSHTRVVAPFSGTVEEKLVDRGELVSPGTPVVRLVSSGQVKVEAGVPERYAGQLQRGASVQVIPSVYGAEPRGGHISFVGAAVNTESRTIPIEVEVSNEDRALKPEMMVRLLVTNQLIEGAISVPLEAVLQTDEGRIAFVAVEGEDGPVAERRTVAVGPESRGHILIESGIESGEAVIVSGQNALGDGEPLLISRRRDVRQPSASEVAAEEATTQEPPSE